MSLNGSDYTSGAATKLVTPSGASVKQDANGNISFWYEGVEVAYFDKANRNMLVLISPNNPIIGTDANNLYIRCAANNAINLGTSDTESYLTLNSTGVPVFSNVATKGLGLPPIYGLDNRTGITAADASAITLYTTTAAGQLYRINARAFATVGTSATYLIKWTEGGGVRTATLSVTALDTNVSQQFDIQPDNGTLITAQISALSSTTLNVAATVEQKA